jgi:hypothetical protein
MRYVLSVVMLLSMAVPGMAQMPIPGPALGPDGFRLYPVHRRVHHSRDWYVRGHMAHRHPPVVHRRYDYEDEAEDY